MIITFDSKCFNFTLYYHLAADLNVCVDFYNLFTKYWLIILCDFFYIIDRAYLPIVLEYTIKGIDF